jgi:hypothetical protein
LLRRELIDFLNGWNLLSKVGDLSPVDSAVSHCYGTRRGNPYNCVSDLDGRLRSHQQQVEEHHVRATVYAYDAIQS